MMRYKFQRQAFRGRPRQRRAGRGLGPGLEIGQIGRQRAQRILAHALAREMLQRRDVVVGQEFGEPVAPLHRQDRRERIELQRAPGLGIGRPARGR